MTTTVTNKVVELIDRRITQGQERENWERSYTHAKHGVTQSLREMMRDFPGITLEQVNERLITYGWEPLGPDHKPFVWGTIREIHRVSSYAIVESQDPDRRHGKAHFHLYVVPPDEPDQLPYCTSHSYRSLDDALLAGIVFYSEWQQYGLNAALNERLTGYLRRILRDSEDES